MAKSKKTSRSLEDIMFEKRSKPAGMDCMRSFRENPRDEQLSDEDYFGRSDGNTPPQVSEGSRRAKNPANGRSY